MLLKRTVSLAVTGLLAAFLAFGVQAGPAQQEKLEFCKTVAGNYKAGQDARKLGMKQDELESRIMVFIVQLMQAGAPNHIIEMLVVPITDGYFGKSSAEKHFESCMTKESI